ncbi:MAG TPA: ribosomal protein S18-alanine N-acetyltransferase [Thermoanaerobaculia bacterium]|nr:ribosomal protein S18-alanine N-acetyltransferase [Thermoanaerobaculia bacterium]
MPEGIDIAIATANDVDAIHALEVAAFPSPWKREFFASELYSSGRFNLVARRNRVIVGYLFAMWFFDEMHVNKIAVDTNERRKGIADALMDRCFAFARQQRIRLISLEVRQTNAGAQDFYRHLHFEATYVRPRYYPDGEAAVVMTRTL